MLSLIDDEKMDIWPLAEKIFAENISKKDISFIEKRLWYKDNVTNHLKSLLIHSARILRDYKFEIDDKYFHAECHSYNLFGEKVESVFEWHKDDFGATHYEVNTLILYLRKDKTIKNGDLKYKIGKNIYKIDVKGKLMVALRGDIEHCPENMSGFGCRDSIVVQFKRKIPLKT